MTAAEIMVFLDTTELAIDSTLASPVWDSLAQAVNRGAAYVAVSEVSVLEVVRQITEKVSKHESEIGKAERALRAHAIRPESSLAFTSSSFEKALRERLTGRGVRILPLPMISHRDVVERDLSSRKPFAQDGKGYRDYLIWRSITDAITTAADSATEIYLVSRNSKDFGEDGDLHPDLRSDLPAGVAVNYTSKISDPANRVRLYFRANAPQFDEDLFETAQDEGRGAQRSAINEAVSLIEGMRMSEWDSTAEFANSLSPVEEAFITSVEVNREDIEADLVDSVSDTTIWEVRTSAVFEIEGSVFRGEEFRLEPDWSITYGAPDDRYVEVTRTLTCELVTEIRVEADEVTADGVITEVRLKTA